MGEGWPWNYNDTTTLPLVPGGSQRVVLCVVVLFCNDTGPPATWDRLGRPLRSEGGFHPLHRGNAFACDLGGIAHALAILEKPHNVLVLGQ